MADFGLTLSRLAQFLAERQAAGQEPDQPDPLTSALAGGGGGMGTDPVYGGMFGAIPQMQQAQQLAQQQGGAADVRSGPANLMTRGDVTGIAPALRTLLDAHRATGTPVLANVASDYRTREEQARLYQMYLNGTGNLAARPGTSLHEQGRAFDINRSFLSAHPEVVNYLTSHGFARDVGGEPWHFSWQG